MFECFLPEFEVLQKVILLKDFFYKFFFFEIGFYRMISKEMGVLLFQSITRLGMMVFGIIGDACTCILGKLHFLRIEKTPFAKRLCLFGAAAGITFVHQTTLIIHVVNVSFG
jgi:hypothetical protein